MWKGLVMRLVEVVDAVLDIRSPKNQVGVAVLVEVTVIHGHPTTPVLECGGGGTQSSFFLFQIKKGQRVFLRPIWLKGNSCHIQISILVKIRGQGLDGSWEGIE